MIETISKKHRQLPVLLFLSLCLLSCGHEPEAHEFRGDIMGTFYQVKIITSGQGRSTLEPQIKARMDEVNQLMSNWVSDSDVSRFNAHQATTPMAIDAHTRRVVARALELAQQSDGVLDPTISPLIELWGFGTRENNTVPEDAVITAALASMGYQKLRLSDEGLSKEIPELTLNLSSLAKGYAVDRVAELLDEHQVDRYMVNIGGDVRVKGLNGDGVPWRMAIEAPNKDSLNAIYKITELRDVAMATSGDYRNYFLHDGVQYSHIIDPRTGKPIPARITSVSVVAPDCMTADALATAFMVLKPEESVAMAEKLEGVDCLILLREGDNGLTEVMSSGMARHFAD